MSEVKHIHIFTDGACIGNPGPGGYGVILRYGSYQRELSGGYRRTTNNRMELLAAIRGLEALKERCRVTVHSDSEYLVRMMDGGWPREWEANGWKRGRRGIALNPDLWGTLLRLCEAHEVEYTWVKGHAGIAENERCDRLAMEAAQRADLPVDEGYENARGGAAGR